MSWINTILQGAAVLSANLKQSETNGLSLLGTLNSSQYGAFLMNNPLPQGFPWGTRTTSSNPKTDCPLTGVTRRYDWTIKRGYLAPDGVNKSMVLINGQFPGPLIEANWGDTISVTIRNRLDAPEEGTSMHWHGFLQSDTPWYDGVPSVQQCPIAPGKDFTYTFKAEMYGTSWYHTHLGSQYMDGPFGPITIYGPTQIPYDVDLGPVILNDWFHTNSSDFIRKGFSIPAVITFPDNNLINGKMDYDCSLITNGSYPAQCTSSAGLAKFKFMPGKTHRLRLINAGSAVTQKFTIDGYRMTVIANDFVPVKPYTTNVVTLGVGQRTDILVKATGKGTDSVWMRADMDTGCFPGPTQPHALAAIYYPEANQNARPTTKATGWVSGNCGNDVLSSTVPLVSAKPPSTPAVTQKIDMTLGFNETGSLLFFMNAESFRANWNNPLLLLANLGNTSYPQHPEWNTYNFGKNTSIRFIVNNYTPIPHAMHLHAHNFWILAEGTGVWDGNITNQDNPQRRDTHLTGIGTATMPYYTVVEFETDNPGVWPFHCHLSAHSAAGMLINVIERPDLIPDKQIPSVIAQTCRDWAAWSGTHVVDQIDSGL
ncbi:extracellular dihydrogeodin oxidase/laccase-like protein [Bisporella sp. PMI_857]|nr:extracellular dihydrogeodin oxidase/laccase-like protein [Bisporella sp. PMI_857]